MMRQRILLIPLYVQVTVFIVFFLLSSKRTICAFSVLKPSKINPTRFQSRTLRTILSSSEVDYSFLSDDVPNCSKEDLLSKDQLDYITQLVNKRSTARNDGDYDLADSIRGEITALTEMNDRFILPEGYIIEIQDIPRKEGGGSTWCLQLGNKEPIDWVNVKQDDENNNGESVLKIAHSALGLASWSSENSVPVDQEKLNNLVIQAKERLRVTGSRELRGRKAADAAFWFAMAGVDDDINSTKSSLLNFSLFDALTFVCIEELRRFGKRPSCRPTDIMHMVERIAAAGVKSEMALSLHQKAAECLATKDMSTTGLIKKGILNALQNNSFELHTERPLLWIWRFSTRQRKQQAFLKSASKHWESNDTINNSDVSSRANDPNKTSKWDSTFDDVTLPLVVDIGCGMGISILGLATASRHHESSERPVLDMDWSSCNYVGADLSQLAINYASSVSHRWKLKGRVQFDVVSAEEILESVIDSYPGPVKLIMIQFPTPFTFQKDKLHKIKDQEESDSVSNQGNRQLPTSAYSGFMVTQRLLELACTAVTDSSGKLLLQSNCEDVAVLMKNVAVDEVGFQTIDVKNFNSSLDDNKVGLTKRTEKWISMGGERAEGPCWSSTPLLPIRGSTETETACLLNETPIHRCLLRVNDKAMVKEL